MNADTSLSVLRNIAFAARCRRAITDARKAASTEPVADIVHRVVFTPAPGYFLSYDRALVGVYRWLQVDRTRRPRDTPPHRRIADITDAVQSLLETKPMPVTHALSRVLASESAPEFYIDPRYAMRIYRKFKNHPLLLKSVS